jgi:signal transduction histidine kinase
VSKPLGELIRRVDATIETVRRISTSLRPSLLDHLGLWAAIEWQARQFEAAARISCQLGLDMSEVEPDAERATAAFRIFQEALTNVARHAHATRAEVNARLHEGWLVLEITDDGCGIAEQDPHTTPPLGIFGMHERAQALGGEFELISRPSVGTTAVLRLPLGLDR